MHHPPICCTITSIWSLSSRASYKQGVNIHKHHKMHFAIHLYLFGRVSVIDTLTIEQKPHRRSLLACLLQISREQFLHDNICLYFESCSAVLFNCILIDKSEAFDTGDSMPTWSLILTVIVSAFTSPATISALLSSIPEA